MHSLHFLSFKAWVCSSPVPCCSQQLLCIHSHSSNR